ncbi:MAG: sigma-70 family RNA polymerase sigma factor [Oscillospiraceae bacterium]|nr:sigma-70 family RNA polymerase sigma factor [Oscillospiraceae bacterium]
MKRDRPAIDAEAHLGLAHLCANRFRDRGIEYEELYSAACLGLVKAAHAFDPERGVCFSTYAVPVIMGEIRRLFREGRSVHVGRKMQTMAVRAARICEQLRQETGSEPTVGQIAGALGVSEAEAAEILCASMPAVSLTVTTEDGETETEIAVPSHEQQVTERLALHQVLGALPEGDRELLRLRYALCLTQSETGRRLGMTQVQVSRREKKLLLHLREELLK